MTTSENSMVGQDMAWTLCLATVGVLLASTFALKRIDVRKPRAIAVTSHSPEGSSAS